MYTIYIYNIRKRSGITSLLYFYNCISYTYTLDKVLVFYVLCKHEYNKKYRREQLKVVGNGVMNMSKKYVRNGLGKKALVWTLGLATLASVGFGPMKLVDVIKQKLDKDDDSSFVLPNNDEHENDKERLQQEKQELENKINNNEADERRYSEQVTDKLPSTYQNTEKEQVEVKNDGVRNFEYDEAQVGDIQTEVVDFIPDDYIPGHDYIFVSESDLAEAEEILSQEQNGNQQSEPEQKPKTGYRIEFDDLEK